MNPTPPAPAAARPPRILVYLPSWLGDTAMATPTLRLIRDTSPGSVIVGLGRPGAADLLAGTDFLDDLIEADARKLMGPPRVASRLVPFRLDAALLLPNSFASAVTVRLAGIPVRVGYDRDARGMLLTHRLQPARRGPPAWKTTGYEPVSAVGYYLDAGKALLGALGLKPAPAPVRLELAVSDSQRRSGEDVLARAGALDAPFVLMNPGGNNPAKRWPLERFAALGHHLITVHGLKVLINGSPGEADVVRLIRDALVLNHPEDESRVACLTELGINVGSLKEIVRRARLMVTNDTGPRHIAAALGTPCVTLFGPTDPRWTTLPSDSAGPPRELVLVADPNLPRDEVADEHPERCRIDRIPLEAVVGAADSLLGR